MRFMLRSKFL